MKTRFELGVLARDMEAEDGERSHSQLSSRRVESRLPEKNPCQAYIFLLEFEIACYFLPNKLS